MIQYKECGKWFHRLGFARYRAMHRDNRGKGNKQKKDTPKYELWEFFNQEHGLTLLDEQIDDILTAVDNYKEQIKDYSEIKTLLK